jgi:peptidoglycan/LPS O-acetylase OafA/YrhL
VARPAEGPPPAAAVPAASRLHWIDWLRVAAIAGVFVYHTLRAFNTDDWHVKNAETSVVLDGLTTFFTAFGLAVLFLLAGAGVRFALRKRSWNTFLRERTARLLVPFVIGTLLLGPVQGYIEATHKGTFSGSIIDFISVWTADVVLEIARGPSPGVFGIGYHLWFLGYLFVISVIALPLFVWLSDDRGRHWIDALGRRSGWRGATLTLVVPIYVMMGIGAAIDAEEHWFEFFWYLGYFLIGFLLVSDDRFAAAVRRDLGPSVGLAVVSTGLFLAGIPAPLDTVGEHGMGPIDLAIVAIFAAMGWAWTLLILNLGMRLSQMQRPVSERLGDAVLPVYVIHQPVILAVAFFVVEWPLGILLKWLIVFGISAPITWLLVELALRMRITRLLIGARVREAASDIPTATGVLPRQARSPRLTPEAHHGRPR